MYKKIALMLSLGLVCFGFTVSNTILIGRLKISPNKRYFTTAIGKPFFWMGDTGWLLFSKLNREEAERYLEDRRVKGFNVIQVMLLHDLAVVNVYGDTALINKNVATPLITHGSAFSDKKQYDYWDHVDYIIDLAAKKGIYMAMVPVWGSNVKGGKVTRLQAEIYARFLAERYKDRPNVIWMNGGDIAGSDSIKVWNTIGNTLHQVDPQHLITYHPRGRTQSSKWFHNEAWLSFNCFQSGHRDYSQDTSKKDLRYGEDNWKYVLSDYDKVPAKPTLDAEPSYEDIPHGLHDTTLARWTAADVRRYAYWSVFAGACGYTYGDNSVIQMLKPNEKGAAYGAKAPWFDAINHTGASQMQYLKKLMLSRSYFDRVPDQSIIVDAKQGERYDRLAATRGLNYAFIYSCNGRSIDINLGKIAGKNIKASWYDPRNGQVKIIGIYPNSGTKSFRPQGKITTGDDWVLILDSV